MLGLTIGEKHTYNDFRLKMLSSFVVSPPEPVVNKIQIPGMDGMLDISENKYAHIIGGGTSDTDRKNIHTVDWDGNAEYAGTVETTAIILKSSTEGSEKRFKVIQLILKYV